MDISQTWSIPGAEGLPIYGNTLTPAGEPRGHAIVIHGWTGNKDRNITPVVASHLASIGLTTHRITLSHAGVDRDGDRITRSDAFFRDSLACSIHDIRAVMEHAGPEVARLADQGLHTRPILIGHSRAGASIIRVAAMAEREQWPVKPRALISLAGTAAYTRFTEAMRAELAEKGYLEAPCSRGPQEWGGGVVRMSRTWYDHHFDAERAAAAAGSPAPDLFAEDAAAIACPLLIVHGDADTSVPLANAHRVRDLVATNPRATVELAIIPGGDHNFGVAGFGTEIAGLGNPALLAACAAVTGFVEQVLSTEY